TLFPGDKNSEARAFHPGGSSATLPDPEQLVAQIDPSCWGQPRKAVVVPAPRGAEATVDPAPLAVNDSGEGPPANCFRGPVGVVAPGVFVRVVLAYEEAVPLRDGKLHYRLPLPTCKLAELSVSLQADESLARKATIEPADATSKQAEGK